MKTKSKKKRLTRQQREALLDCQAALNIFVALKIGSIEHYKSEVRRLGGVFGAIHSTNNNLGWEYEKIKEIDDYVSFAKQCIEKIEKMP